MTRRGLFSWAALLLWLIGTVGVCPAPSPFCCLPPAAGQTALAPVRMACCLPPPGLSAVPLCCRVMPRAALAPPAVPALAVPAFALAAVPAPPAASVLARSLCLRLPQARAVWTEPPCGGRGPRGPPLFS